MNNLFEIIIVECNSSLVKSLFERANVKYPFSKVNKKSMFLQISPKDFDALYLEEVSIINRNKNGSGTFIQLKESKLGIYNINRIPKSSEIYINCVYRDGTTKDELISIKDIPNHNEFIFPSPESEPDNPNMEQYWTRWYGYVPRYNPGGVL